MKNEEKAGIISGRILGFQDGKTKEIFDACMEMAKWKDEQFSKQNKWHKVANDKVGSPFEDYEGHDWVLAQFQDHRDGFMYLPHIAEWSKDKQCWHVIESDDEEFVYEVLDKCIAWCELPEYEKE